MSADPKQTELDQRTAQLVEEHGGVNYLKANYIRSFAEKAIGANDAILGRLQPDVNVDMEDPAWRQAMCVALAFVKRYKLTETRACLEKEFPPEAGLPSKSGFSKSHELDAFFEKVEAALKDIRYDTFEKNVDQFAKDAGIAVEKPKTRSERTPSEKSGSRRHHRHGK